MSKRIAICAGVIQRLNGISAAGSGSARPASSATSRIAAARWAASAPGPAAAAPSAGSTAPPGKTQAPPMKRAAGFRRSSRTSSAASPPRSTITVAAWRGSTGGPSVSSSPGAGRASSIAADTRLSRMSTETVQQWICESCGFIYDPAEGDPDGGIPPGTAFEDIPSDWYCPVCGARKADFVPYED